MQEVRYEVSDEIDRVESYQIGADTFCKEYLKDGQVCFRKNDRILSLESWNWEINRFQSMELKEKHPSPLIQWMEKHRRRGFLNLVDAKFGEKVADVGAESGYLAAQLVRRGCRVICLDIDPSLLVTAQKHIGTKSVWFVASDIRRVSVPASTFDVTIASEILEHLPDPLKGLNELVRITRPGGRIFLSVPNDKLVLSAKKMLRLLHLTRFLGQLSHDIAIGHLQILNRSELHDLCLRANAVVEKLYYHKPLYLNVFAQLRKTEM